MIRRTLSVALTLVAVACGGSDINSPYTGQYNPPGTTPPVDTTPTTPPPPTTPTTVTTGFVDRTVVDAGITYAFKVFVPANYNTATKVPVILFLHGSNQKGSDNVLQTNDGLGPVVKAQASTFPAIVVFPQAPANETGRQIFVRIAPAALDKVMAEYTKSDPTRVYLTGLSFGAVHGFDVAYRRPTTFAAFVPISGDPCGLCITGNSSTTQAQGFQFVAPTLKSLPIWQFQGELDSQVSTTDVRLEVLTLQGAGSPIKYFEYKGAGHTIWDDVYQRADMWAWLWAQHR